VLTLGNIADFSERDLRRTPSDSDRVRLTGGKIRRKIERYWHLGSSRHRLSSNQGTASRREHHGSSEAAALVRVSSIVDGLGDVHAYDLSATDV
jgi:hypothetical protein